MAINIAQQKPIDRKVDFKLLKKQAETVGLVESCLRDGKLVSLFKGKKAVKQHAELLLGTWNLLQSILDDLETGKECVLER
jgi:hypothetical protein